MEINTTIEGTHATLAPLGKLTVATAPSLEAAFVGLPEDIESVDLDLSELSYVASAGLRVIVSGSKLLRKRNASLRLLHPCEEVMEIFEVTGLVEILTIEP